MRAFRAESQPDGTTKYVEMSDQEIHESIEEGERRHAKREARKGHDCNDHVVHGDDPEMALRDYYYCGVCGDVLQVG